MFNRYTPDEHGIYRKTLQEEPLFCGKGPGICRFPVTHRQSRLEDVLLLLTVSLLFCSDKEDEEELPLLALLFFTILRS